MRCLGRRLLTPILPLPARARRLGSTAAATAKALQLTESTWYESQSADLERRGLINSDGIPNWTLKTTFYWEQRFPSRRELVVEHRYKPSVGSTVDLPTSDLADVLNGPLYSKYCIEKSFLNDLSKEHDQFGQMRIDYILTTGANWSGPIRQFRVLVDKGAPDSLVSFCGQNVRKIAPTQFEMKVNNFIPRSNLSVLILKRYKQDNGSQNQDNDNPRLFKIPRAVVFGTSETVFSRRQAIASRRLAALRHLEMLGVSMTMRDHCLCPTNRRQT